MGPGGSFSDQIAKASWENIEHRIAQGVTNMVMATMCEPRCGKVCPQPCALAKVAMRQGKAFVWDFLITLN